MTLQFSSQVTFGSRQSAHHRADRQIQLFGDLSVGELLEIEHQHHRAERIRQLIKGLGGELVCCEMSVPASETMNLLEIPEVIRCFDTQREAIDAVKKGPPPRTRPVAS